MDPSEIKAPGLKWRARAGGELVAYWVAKPAAVAAGYPVKTANLTGVPLDCVAARCERLEEEMLAFMGKPRTPEFIGTLGSLLEIYQTHEESPYRGLKPSSLKPYNTYLPKLIAEHGAVRLDRLTGLDIKAWHKVWRAPVEEGAGERLGAAAMRLSIIKAAVSFGFVSNFPHCERLTNMMRELRLPSPAPRDQAPTAADIDKARAAAHALGKHRAAFCYALQFETIARQWDLIGQWVEMSDPRPSAVLANGRKWIGPTWANIDDNFVLTIVPTKTETTTRAKVHVNLSKCGMVMEELARIPESGRVGPLIIHEATGLPYLRSSWEWLWREVRTEAGLSEKLWNRDLRAGGNTEAEIAGATTDDRAKLGAHSSKVNAAVYSRDVLAASDRVVEARARFRREARDGKN